MKNPELEDVIFGKILRELRQNLDKTQEELGLDAGLSRNFISLLELGQRRPTLKTLIALSKGLNLPISEIMKNFEMEFEKNGNNKT